MWPKVLGSNVSVYSQVYAARLFRLSNASGGKSFSAEEALGLMKKQSERNQFYRTLSANKSSSEPTKRDEELTGKRDVVNKVMVSQSLPSFYLSWFMLSLPHSLSVCLD